MTRNIQILLGDDGKPTMPSSSTAKWFIDSKGIERIPGLKDVQTGWEIPWGTVFSSPQRGNAVEFLTTGSEYFEKAAASISGAQSSVFIAGWQVNYDILLTSSGKTLFECLLDALKNGAGVYVMPWLAPPGPVDTGYLPTLLAVSHLNAHPEAKGKAYCLPAPGQSDQGPAAIGFSHHQKQVVIDNKIAFLGGIDLAYGRRDDANFSLKANGRSLNEIYNPCVPPIHKTKSVELADCVTTAELMAAAFTQGALRSVSTFATSPSEGVLAKAIDLKNSGAERVRDVSASISDFFKISLIDDIQNAAQDIAMDGAQAVSRWAWGKLDDAFRERIKSIAKYHGGNAADTISAVYAWLQGCDLSLLPPELMAETRHAVEALIHGIVASIHSAADKPKHYERLFEKVRMVSGAYIPDAGTQPRMPWQDVHCRVEGPSVFDLSRNFVRRWNGLAVQFEKSLARYRDPTAQFIFKHAGLKLPLTPKAARIDPAHMPRKPLPDAPRPGTCWVQVLRSAPCKMQDDESLAAGETQGAMLAQNNCLKGMLQIIRGAQHFLYIEGQFFQSDHGGYGPVSETHSGPMGVLLDIERNPAHPRFAQMLGIAGLKPREMIGKLRWAKIDDVRREVQGEQYMQDLMAVLKNVGTVEAMRMLGAPQDKLLNPVGRALVERIEQAIREGQPFHVYLVLPVHPEGTLDTLNIISQVHLTMHSLVFGDDSLVNGVRRALLVRRYQKEKKIGQAAAEKIVRAMKPQVFRKAVGDEWKEHLTLLNLRNWDTLGGQPVTEQIYVHSKLLIADDRVALLGSANINDRSLLGGRDSELAVVVTDDAKIKIRLDGEHPADVGAAIHRLRRGLWEKHFGLKSANRRAAALAGADILDSPAAPATWKAIQKVAADNTKAYEEAFWFIPRSGARPEIQPQQPADDDPPPPASLWPTWQYKDYLKHDGSGRLLFRMPFDPLFWRAPGRGDVTNSWNVGKDEKAQLAKPTVPEEIQGFITELPTRWTDRENNLASEKHLIMLAGNGAAGDASPPGTALAASGPARSDTETHT